jgi:2,3-bisphosphoglycerate-dependent phosphoglycerate mutase
MRLYFVRHGESEANRLNEFSNRGLKHGLTPGGTEQAKALANSLKGLSVARLFSSPLLRAVQTAQILSEQLGVSYEVTDALREFDCGILEGKSDAGSWGQFDALNTAWMRDRDWEQKIEGGESFLEIRQRFVPFVERLVTEYEGSGQSIIAVGHGGLYRCMLPLVLVNVDAVFAVKQAIHHADCITAELRPEGLVCLAWGQTTL